MRRWILCLLLLPLLSAFPAQAAIYCSQETLAELPSQWRGFLLDQRLLRLAAIPPRMGQPTNPVRLRYLAEAEALRKAIGTGKPTADQAADLGALLLRLGETNKALEVLLPAQRENLEHFRLNANLATALHLAGELTRARETLRDSIRLAPEKLRPIEELHLRLVQQRLRETRNTTSLDDLFGVRYQMADGQYKPGDLDPEERKKLPRDAVARLQALALSFPFDARLLWQLGELAAAHGDVITAAAMLEGCVGEFNWGDPLLRDHRKALRAAADELLKAGQGKEAHVGHHKIETRSSRPLVSRIDQVPPPPIDPKGINPLTWSVVSDTVVDSNLHPTFPRRLQDLDGLQVTLPGYMQPLGEDQDCAAFLLIEFPIGCWLCEMPGLTGLVMVEMPASKTQPFTRQPLEITGKLKLNRTDPESFLFQINAVKVKVGE
jgi:hypothetical protein